jgi:hypothetical protein
MKIKSPKPVSNQMLKREIPEKYILPPVRSDWSELLSDWQPLIPQSSLMWLLTKFGEIFFCHQDEKIGMLQVSAFQYKTVAKDKTDFQEWLVDPDKMSEWFLAPLVDRLEAVGKFLQSEQCYSFIKPLGLGGTLTVENVMIVPIREHFGLWGEVFRQIKNMPEGGEVVLKFK